MTDPTAIIGTVDLLARRLADLHIRYKDWVSNPEEYERLSKELKDFSENLNNVNVEVNNSSSINPNKLNELNNFIHSTKLLFDQSKQDLDNLEKTFLKQTHLHLSDPPSTSHELLCPQADGNSQIHHTNSNTIGQSSNNKPNDCSTPINLGKKRFKKFTQQTANNIKSFTRVKRDTEILKTVDDRLREGKTLLLSISNFIHLQHSITLSKQDPPKFIQHFDSPFQSDNWVVDFSLTPSSPNLNTVQTSDLHPHSIPVSPQSKHLSQEAQVKQILLSSLPNPNQATHSHQLPSICVYGQGGMGKSVALQSICHDQHIRTTFYDGVHFLTLGQNATTQDLIHQFSMCARHAGYKQISKDIMGMKSADEAAREVNVIFKGKRVLFVADDLWVSDRSGTGFLREIQVMGGMSEGAILFSTRDEILASEGREKVFFDFLEPIGEGSRMILERCVKTENHEPQEKGVFEGLGGEAKRAIHKILELCGGWKLCLAVAGGALSEDIRDCGNDVSLGLTTYVSILREDEERLIHETTADYHERNLITIAESSVRRCKEWSEKRAIRRLSDGKLGIEEMFRSLCVIEKQKWMGVREVCWMWGVSEEYGGTVVKQMGRMNLVSRKLERGEDSLRGSKGGEERDVEWVVRVHDRMIDVCVDLAEEKDDEGAKKWHKLLLDRYIQEEDSGNAANLEREEGSNEVDDYILIRNRGKYREWWDKNKMSGKYMMRNVARHLVGGGMWDELFFLVTDVRWTLRRREEGGLADLRDDFDRLINVLICHEKRRKQSDETKSMSERESDGMQILVDVISDCWDILRRSMNAFGFQVFGMFHEQDTKYCAVSQYMSSIERNGPKPWVRPMRTGFLAYEDKRQRGQLRLKGDRYSEIRLSPNQDFLCTSHLSDDFSTLYIVHLRSRRMEELKFKVHATPTCFDFCCANWQVAFGFMDGRIEIWDVETELLFGKSLWAHSTKVTRVSFNETGSRLGSTHDDGTARIWNTSKGELVGKPFPVKTKNKERCRFTQVNGNLKLVSVFDNSLYIQDGETDRLKGNGLVITTNRNKGLTHLIFDDCCRFGITHLTDNTTQAINIHTGTLIGKPLLGDTSNIRSLGLNHDNTFLVTGCYNGQIRLWNVNTGSQIGTPLLGHSDPVTYVGFRNDGTSIMSVGYDETLRFWSVPSNDEPTQTPISKDDYSTMLGWYAFSGNGNRILSLTDTHTYLPKYTVIFQLWDMTTNQLTKKLLEHNSDVTCVALNEDGSRLIMGMQDGSALVRNVDTTSLIGHPLIRQAGTVDCVALNKDGSYAVIGSEDNSLQVWDVNMSVALGTPLLGHSNRVRSVSISSSGKHVVSGSDDLTVRIWDTETSSQIGELHGDYRYSPLVLTLVLFSSDDDRIISWSSNDEDILRVWSIEHEQEICKPFKLTKFENFSREKLNRYETWLQEQLTYIRSRPTSNDVKQSHVCMRTLNNDMNRILGIMKFAVLKQYDCESKNGENCNTDDRERFGNYFNIAAAVVNVKSVELIQSNGEALVLANMPRNVQNYEIRGHSIRYTIENGEFLVCKIEE